MNHLSDGGNPASARALLSALNTDGDSLPTHKPRSPPASPLSAPPSPARLERLIGAAICHVPGWKHLTSSDVSIKQLTGGLTNTLWTVSTSVAGIEPADVVVRIFGADTAALFSREWEQRVSAHLSSQNIGARILAIIPNGRIESFIYGRTLKRKDLKDPRIQTLVAEQFALLHSQRVVQSEAPVSALELRMRQWFEAAAALYWNKPRSWNAQQNDMFAAFALESPEWTAEFHWLTTSLAALDSPVVFCHCDLQEGNLILQTTEKLPRQFNIAPTHSPRVLRPPRSHSSASDAPPQQSPVREVIDAEQDDAHADSTPRPYETLSAFELIQLSRGRRCADVAAEPFDDWKLHSIDFEYSSYAPAAFDLANHMCEHAIDYSNPHYPHFTIDTTATPEPDMIRRFVHAYHLFNRERNGQDVSADGVDADVIDRDVVRVRWYMLASHFLWSMWGILQSTKSAINFGYVEYARDRLAEYRRLKAQLIRAADSDR